MAIGKKIFGCSFWGPLWWLLTLLLSSLSSWRQIRCEIRSKHSCLSTPVMSLGEVYKSQCGVGSGGYVFTNAKKVKDFSRLQTTVAVCYFLFSIQRKCLISRILHCASRKIHNTSIGKTPNQAKEKKELEQTFSAKESWFGKKGRKILEKTRLCHERLPSRVLVVYYFTISLPFVLNLALQ